MTPRKRRTARTSADSTSRNSSNGRSRRRCGRHVTRRERFFYRGRQRGPEGAVFALLFTLLEFFGSLALIIGFLTEIVAVLFVLEMTATTIFSKTKLKKKFVLGYELDVAYAAFALVLAFLGPGAWSLDHLLGWA